MALSDYDHTRDLANGRVNAEGITLLTLDFQVEEIFYRSLKHHEFDACELSFGAYISLTSQGDTTFSAIPVFPSRMFRQSSGYVLRDGPIKTVDDLRGRRIGLPEWAQTAGVYSRGFLEQQYGLRLTDVEWVQAGTNQPGREENVALRVPPGVKLGSVKDKSLNEMLLSGEIAAIFSAHPPHAFEHGDPRVVRLFADYQAVEQAYYEATRIFPIMHVVAIKRAILERDPWVARNLYNAFEEAKVRSYARAAEATASRFPIPWSVFYFERARELFGPDPLPYGVEANRITLEAFATFAHAQGVAHRRVGLAELFCETMGDSFRV
jgi:4,5-dihydroxyphthalate decarboxylase